jgi:NNP family nitrate/nitrite transporter-like MFS transporter
MRQDEQHSFPVGPILSLVAIIFMNFGARMIFSPLLIPIEDDLQVTHATAGSFFLTISVGYSITMLFSGFISKRLLHRGTVILSVLGVGTSLLIISFSSTLLLFRVGLVLLGITGGLYAPSGLSTVTSIAQPQHWGKAMSLHEIGPVMAFVLAPVIAEIGLRVASWRDTLMVMGIVCFLIGLLYIIRGRGGEYPGEPPHLRNIFIILRKPAFRIIAVIFIVMVGLEIGVYAMLPTYLIVEHGMDRGLVNTIVGISRGSTLVALFISGWLADTFGTKFVIGGIAGIAGILTVLLGVLHGIPLVVVVFLQPLIVAAFFPVILTAIADVTYKRIRNVAVSLIIPVGYFFGAGAVPAWLGYLADIDYFSLGFIALGVLMLACLVLLKRLQVPRKG